MRHDKQTIPSGVLAAAIWGITCSLALSPATIAEIIHVPGDQPTIQAGIDAALPGDLVIVADGIYTGAGNKNLSFHGKAITVKSVNGPDGCIIDCQMSGRGFFFQDSETPASVIDGLTIRNGNVVIPGGGGIRCESASPTIRNCLITGNRTADEYGGGIACKDSSPVIIDNTITHNVAHGRSGGIECWGASPLIQNNIILENESLYEDAGGIGCVHGSSPLIADNTITSNICSGGGGGIFCHSDSEATIFNNTISENQAGGWGGGIDCWFSAPLIVQNVIADNQAAWGGGLHFYESYPARIADCRITGNVGDWSGFGGAVLGEVSDLTVTNCLIAGNTGYPGGMYCYNGWYEITSTTFTGNWGPAAGAIIFQSGAANMRNCILWGDAEYEIDAWDTAFSISYSIVQGGWPGAGNLDADPLFAAGPLGDYYLSQLAAGQPANSPGLDVGGDPASSVCFTALDETFCLDQRTTRTDQLSDAGTVDLGYHYAPADLPPLTVSLACIPAAGTLPFGVQMMVTLENHSPDQIRRMAARLAVDLAGGQHYENWRSGWSDISPNGSFFTAWLQLFPAQHTLVGDNVFQLIAEDVTPSPFNQPPYLPSGTTAADASIVTGNAP